MGVLMDAPRLIVQGDLETPVVVVAGRRDDVVQAYTWLEQRSLVDKNRALASYFDGTYMIIISGDSRLSINVLHRLRAYLNDYLYRKSER